MFGAEYAGGLRRGPADDGLVAEHSFGEFTPGGDDVASVGSASSFGDSAVHDSMLSDGGGAETAVSGPAAVHEVVVLSQLSEQEREAWLQVLTNTPDLELTADETGTYTAQLECPRSAAPPPAPLARTANSFSSLRVRGGASRTAFGRSMTLGTAAGAHASSGSRRGVPKAKVRTLKWLVQLIHELYKARSQIFHVELGSTAGEFENFSAYTYHFLNEKFGLKSIVRQHSEDILLTVRRYREENCEVDTFARFLCGDLDSVDLLFYLFARARVLPESLPAEWDAPPQSPSFVPTVKSTMTAFERVVPADNVAGVVRIVFARQPAHLLTKALAAASELVAEARSRRGGEKQGGKKRAVSLDVHALLYAMTLVYHEHNVAQRGEADEA